MLGGTTCESNCQSLSDLSRQSLLSAVTAAEQGFKHFFIHNAELVIKKSNRCETTIRWFTNTRISIRMPSGKLSTSVADVSFIIHIIDPCMDHLSASCDTAPRTGGLLFLLAITLFTLSMKGRRSVCLLVMA